MTGDGGAVATNDTVALDCNPDAGTACAAPAQCVVTDLIIRGGVCYPPERGRCGPGNCSCPAGTSCWFPADFTGAMDGMCLTPAEAARRPMAQRAPCP